MQPPLTALDLDEAATKRVLDHLDGPVVFVGNSYDGSIITVAGGDSMVKSLVYVVALQPEGGETSAEAVALKSQTACTQMTTEDGFFFLEAPP